MDSFFENARKIFDVARSASDNSAGREGDSFALVVRPDGGLHFIMEGAVSLEGAAAYTAARSAYIVTRSAGGVKVEGQSGLRNCLLEERRAPRPLFREAPAYEIAAPGGKLLS